MLAFGSDVVNAETVTPCPETWSPAAMIAWLLAFTTFTATPTPTPICAFGEPLVETALPSPEADPSVSLLDVIETAPPPAVIVRLS